MDEDFILAIITVPEDAATEVTDGLTASGLVSAVVAVSGVRTVYRSKSVKEDDRQLLLAFTTAESFHKLAEAVRDATANRPFAVAPLPVLAGEAVAREWTEEHLSGEKS